MNSRLFRTGLALFAMGAALLTYTQTAFGQDVIYKPVAGEFCAKVDVRPQPEAGKATQSVSLYRVDTGAQLDCTPAENDTVVEFCQVVAVADLPLDVKARAWENPDCSGEQTDSVNQGTFELGAPAAPVFQ